MTMIYIVFFSLQDFGVKSQSLTFARKDLFQESNKKVIGWKRHVYTTQDSGQ